MVLVSYSGKEINAKIVFYGPGLCGKTTNLEYIYGSIPSDNRGKMVSMKTKTERTLFFDFLPLNLGELAGFKTRFLLYTVPGQVYYNATRKLVLKGVDAVVFVADSQRGKMDENIESFQNLKDNLKEHGHSLDQIPYVLQYNKRDLPDLYSVEEMDRVLNTERVPAFEGVATTGVGVFETFRSVSKLLLAKLSKEVGAAVVQDTAVSRALDAKVKQAPPAPASPPAASTSAPASPPPAAATPPAASMPPDTSADAASARTVGQHPQPGQTGERASAPTPDAVPPANTESMSPRDEASPPSIEQRGPGQQSEQEQAAGAAPAGSGSSSGADTGARGGAEAEAESSGESRKSRGLWRWLRRDDSTDASSQEPSETPAEALSPGPAASDPGEPAEFQMREHPVPPTDQRSEDQQPVGSGAAHGQEAQTPLTPASPPVATEGEKGETSPPAETSTPAASSPPATPSAPAAAASAADGQADKVEGFISGPASFGAVASRPWEPTPTSGPEASQPPTSGTGAAGTTTTGASGPSPEAPGQAPSRPAAHDSDAVPAAQEPHAAAGRDHDETPVAQDPDAMPAGAESPREVVVPVVLPSSALKGRVVIKLELRLTEEIEGSDGSDGSDGEDQDQTWTRAA